MNPKYRKPGLAFLFDLAGACIGAGFFAALIGIGTRNWLAFLIGGVALAAFGRVLDHVLTRWEDKQDAKK